MVQSFGLDNLCSVGSVFRVSATHQAAIVPKLRLHLSGSLHASVWDADALQVSALRT